jgi:GNAT superfamily N-acetyltransferase
MILDILILHKKYASINLKLIGGWELVAEIDGKIVGHVAFSPVTISDGTKDWYGLGPVSVLPDFQKQGVGKELIGKGLSILKKRGGKGCVLWVILIIINALDSKDRLIPDHFILSATTYLLALSAAPLPIEYPFLRYSL